MWSIQRGVLLEIRGVVHAEGMLLEVRGVVHAEKSVAPQKRCGGGDEGSVQNVVIPSVCGEWAFWWQTNNACSVNTSLADVWSQC